MALPWLGFVTPVIDVDPVALDGPDPLGSAAYAGDYAEVRTLGAVDSAGRSAEQTAVARFLSGNPIPMYRTALCDRLEAEPLGLPGRDGGRVPPGPHDRGPGDPGDPLNGLPRAG